MNTKIYITGILLILMDTSCHKEEVTTFTDYDKNWLIVNDEPNDATIHENYLFYKATGIPVYVNDTIGSQPRKDLFGKEFTYYEVLSLQYSLGGVQSGAPPKVWSFKYCNKADVPAALAFLKDEVIPLLPKGVHVPSILLVETFDSNSFGSYAFKGFNTIVIGEVSKIATMDQPTKAKYRAAILRAMLTNAVLNSKYSDVLDHFANTSRKLATSDAYGLYIYSLKTYVTGLPPGVTPTPQAIGFLSTDPGNSYYTPMSTFMDVCMYVEAMLGSTSSEFTAQYGSEVNIMKKHDYIQQILTDLGVQNQ